MAGVDINTLTMEQYLALSRENKAPGMVKPEMRGNVNFEIKSQFIWVDRLTPGAINTWKLLKKAFTQRYCLSSKTPKHLEDIYNFKNMRSSSDTDGLVVVISKLDNLGRDMKKLKENVHAIQVGCQICEGPHLDKECSLNKEVKQVDEVKYGEFRRPAPFNGSNGVNFCVGPPGSVNQTPYGEKRPNLVKIINKFMERAAKRQAEQDECLKTFCQNTKKSRIDHDKIIQKLKSQVKTLAAEVERRVAKLKECKTIFANDGTHLYTPIYYFPEELEYFFANSGFLEDEKSESTELKSSKNLSQNDWLRIRFREVSEIARDKILRDHWRKRFRNIYDDSEDFKDLDRCEESKKNKILGTIINKLHDEWFKGTHKDNDHLEGIIDYFEPILYDGFTDSDDEEYKKTKYKLLGMPYIKPPPFLIEMVKVTRYIVGLGEVYTKIKVSEVEELSRTRGNIPNIRAGIMKEILGNDDEKELYDET
nr:hypothetical protein [Tanacetum cinerariifolium]